MPTSPELESGPTMWRKKPVEIEAKQWDGGEFDTVTGPWRDFLTARDVGNVYAAGDNLCIETLEGKMIASPGDWIIRGVKGEIYPCKPDIFAATYEPASSPSSLSAAREMGRALEMACDSIVALGTYINVPGLEPAGKSLYAKGAAAIRSINSALETARTAGLLEK